MVNVASDPELKKLLYFHQVLSSQEKYFHSTIWKSVQFFTIIETALLSLSVSIASYEAHAAIFIGVLAIILTLIGRYVLVIEGTYFHVTRYQLIKIREKLEYYRLDYFSEIKDAEFAQLSLRDYLKQSVNRPEGVRFSFRILYMIEGLLGWLMIFIVILANEWINPLALSLLISLIISLVYGYRWEISSILRKLGYRMKGLVDP